MRKIIQKAQEIAEANTGLDVETISRRLGVDVQQVLESGNLKQVYFSDLKAIVLRPGLSAHERAYLIAHGLGHHVLHRAGLHIKYSGRPRALRCGSLVTNSRRTSMESEADVFAAYLLVPEGKLRAELSNGWAKDEEDPVLAMSLEFGVPEELMRERLIYEAIHCFRFPQIFPQVFPQPLWSSDLDDSR